MLRARAEPGRKTKGERKRTGVLHVRIDPDLLRQLVEVSSAMKATGLVCYSQADVVEKALKEYLARFED